MMRSKDLLGLAVETASGEQLGTVQGFTFDPESHTVLQYEVHRGIFGRSLLIAAKQVVSISNEKMVVDDLALGGRAGASLDATPA